MVDKYYNKYSKKLQRINSKDPLFDSLPPWDKGTLGESGGKKLGGFE